MKLNPELNEVMTLKIISGEEIIAKVVGIDNEQGTIQLSSPVSVAPGPQGVGLIPSLFTADDSGTITLNTNAVTMVANTSESVRMKYLEATGSIVTPAKKVLMG
jgi:hypothetical protein